MPNRLQPLDLMDFTGGLNLRKNQFQLAENESPDLLNVDIDPRGGFYTRKGWQRWNDDDIIDMEPSQPSGSHATLSSTLTPTAASTSTSSTTTRCTGRVATPSSPNWPGSPPTPPLTVPISCRGAMSSTSPAGCFNPSVRVYRVGHRPDD